MFKNSSYTYFVKISSISRYTNIIFFYNLSFDNTFVKSVLHLMNYDYLNLKME